MLVQNPACRHAELADRVVRRLEGVVIARSYSLLEYNVPREQAARGRKDHARLQLADDQLAGRRRLVRRARDGPPQRSDRDHGTARSAGRLGDSGNQDHQLPAMRRIENPTEEACVASTKPARTRRPRRRAGQIGNGDPRLLPFMRPFAQRDACFLSLGARGSQRHNCRWPCRDVCDAGWQASARI